MNRSDSIKELAAALSKAQAVIEGAAKDKNNPAFKSKYADLASCWDAARKPLTDNGLSVMQFPRLTDNGVEVETILMHVSGEYLGETLTVPLSKRDAHGVGSAITYGRRFSLCALVGISPEDDDGNAAAKKGNGHDEPERSPWTDELKDLAKEAAKHGLDSYQTFWKTLSAETRSVLAQTEEHVQFKKTATLAKPKDEPMPIKEAA